MKTTCITCGEVIEQRSSTPKLYCSDHCCYTQLKEKRYSKEWLEAEKIRRRQSYIESLSAEERDRLLHHKKKEAYYHYTAKPSELTTRLCHDCKRPCVDYRCPDCWLKLRRGNGLTENITETESIWDDF